MEKAASTPSARPGVDGLDGLNDSCHLDRVREFEAESES